jgi:myo-inositol-1(or 4)-monophosphatase
MKTPESENRIYSEELDILKQGMQEAGNIAMAHWYRGVDPEIKTANFDITTVADREVEKSLVSWIKNNYPDASFIGEETGGEARKDGFTIDGIDGTSYFQRGMKDWSITLSKIENSKPVLGIIYAPALQELYHARSGHGAYLNDQRITVSSENNLADSIINLGQDIIRIYNLDNIESRFIKNSRSHYVTASSGLAYGRLAAGKIDIAVHPGQPIWDISAGNILVKEAGGRFTNWQGQEDFVITRERTSNILASNGLLHPAALNIVNSTR